MQNHFPRENENEMHELCCGDAKGDHVMKVDTFSPYFASWPTKLKDTKSIFRLDFICFFTALKLFTGVVDVHAPHEISRSCNTKLSGFTTVVQFYLYLEAKSHEKLFVAE